MAKTEGFIPAVLQLISGPVLNTFYCANSVVKLFKKFMTFFLEEKEMSFSVFIFFLYAKSRPAQQMWGADE